MRSTAERVAEAVREGGVRSRMSMRELARAPTFSPAKSNWVRAAQANPSLDTLAKVVRGLGRNPNLLFVPAGELLGDEARDILRRVFRDGSEHLEVWKWEKRDVAEA